MLSVVKLESFDFNMRHEKESVQSILFTITVVSVVAIANFLVLLILETGMRYISGKYSFITETGIALGYSLILLGLGEVAFAAIKMIFSLGPDHGRDVASPFSGNIFYWWLPLVTFVPASVYGLAADRAGWETSASGIPISMVLIIYFGIRSLYFWKIYKLSLNSNAKSESRGQY